MSVSIDEMMFYGGIAVAAAALIVGIVCILVFKIKKIRLDAQFDVEYGAEIGNPLSGGFTQRGNKG